MKKLTKLLCAALVWALLLGAAVSCAKQPDSPVQDTPKQEDPQPAPAAGLRIAVDSEPAWSAAVQWFASEQGQALFGDAQAWIIANVSWLYILAVALILLMVVLLAFSRYGDIKLGPDHSEPDYSALT